jgi:hypothetical protein
MGLTPAAAIQLHREGSRSPWFFACISIKIEGHAGMLNSMVVMMLLLGSSHAAVVILQGTGTDREINNRVFGRLEMNLTPS